MAQEEGQGDAPLVQLLLDVSKSLSMIKLGVELLRNDLDKIIALERKGD